VAMKGIQITILHRISLSTDNITHTDISKFLEEISIVSSAPDHTGVFLKSPTRSKTSVLSARPISPPRLNVS